MTGVQTCALPISITSINNYIHDVCKVEEYTNAQSNTDTKKDIILNTSILNECQTLIKNNFNVLIYGFGSKFEVLKTLAANYLMEIGDVIFINGGLTTVRLKHVYAKIIHQLHRHFNIEDELIPSRIPEQITLIQNMRLEDHDPNYRLILVIHCMDRLLDFNCTKIHALFKLVEIKAIKLIASIEDTQCSMIWDSDSLEKVQFIYMNIDTFLPYSKEERYLLEEHICNENNKELELTSLIKGFTMRHK